MAEKRPKRNNKSVSLADKANVGKTKPAAKTAVRTKKATRSSSAAKAGKGSKARVATHRVILIAFLSTLILLMAGVMVYAIIYAYNSFKEEPVNSQDVNTDMFTATPADKQDSVAYYILGLFGEDKNTSPTDMLSILAVDKKARSIKVLQMPQDTYLGSEGHWDVKRIADVWANPVPLHWCDTERREIQADEITEENKHKNCGSTVSLKKGSSSGDLARVFNEQYGLYVDGYILFPHDGLVELVNQLGGADVNLEEDMTVGDVEYKQGEQTLDGDAALSYLLRRNDGITGDKERLVRQRKVFLAIFQRLSTQSVELMEKNSIGYVMDGDAALRSNLRTAKIIELMNTLRDIKPSSMEVYVLPGTETSVDDKTYYSPNKAQVLKLLNEKFVPHLPKLTEASLQNLPDVEGGTESEMYHQVLSDVAVNQYDKPKKQETTAPPEE